MILNGFTLNGSTLNGPNGNGNYGSASLAGSSAVTALAFILTAATCSIPASGAVVTAGLYNIDMASAVVPASALVDVQSTAYVLRIPDLSINANASISLKTQQNHESGTSISGTAALLPFQGEGSVVSGSANIIATVELGRATEVKVQNGNAIAVSTAILNIDGVKDINGSATVDAVPSMQYDPDTFKTHDGHTRIKCSAALSLPSDPLHKIASIVNGGFLGVGGSSADSTIAHAGFSAPSCKATVTSSPVIDLYYQASILLPSVNIQASPHLLKNNSEIVPVSGRSLCYFTGYRLISPFIGFNGKSDISANVGKGLESIAIITVNGVLVADGDGYKGGLATILGSNTVIASMASNPRAHAAYRRTLTMSVENTTIVLNDEDRTIVLSGL